jgi:hypothetical protein
MGEIAKMDIQELIQAYKALSPTTSFKFRAHLLSLSIPLTTLPEDLVLLRILPHCLIPTLLALSRVNKAC